MRRIRVLVVEDSLTIRKYLVGALEGDSDVQVVGEAEDGKRAFELCQELRPDAVSMDMMLPVMSGLAATECIMAFCPTPILIVSASINRGQAFKTYDALSAGAVDVLDKPVPSQAQGQWEQAYRQAIKRVARIKVITHPRAALAGRQPHGQALGAGLSRTSDTPFRCVAIGASTGGPGAVALILKGLPSSFPLPILLVVHVGSAFEFALPDWLDTVSPLRVRNAAHGQPMPRVGTPGVLVAPPDSHLVLRDNRLQTTAGPERNFCRPSVDVLFESLAAEMGGSVIACLLTGMGRDGAEGMLAIKRAGGMTLAQNQESCVVFGMPGEAIRLKGVHQVLGLHEIAPALQQLATPPTSP
ncbi:MAG: chemotaxis-specific protein-glutamate methyltransferase CheB [Limisphaerales bacterium]